MFLVSTIIMFSILFLSMPVFSMSFQSASVENCVSICQEKYTLCTWNNDNPELTCECLSRLIKCELDGYCLTDSERQLIESSCNTTNCSCHAKIEIDDSWSSCPQGRHGFDPCSPNVYQNGSCPGCICTHLTWQEAQCTCLTDCPSANTSYFYIANLDPLDSLSGLLYHPVALLNNSSAVVQVNYSFPTYSGALFHFCQWSMDSAFCVSLHPIGVKALILSDKTVAIGFRYYIKPQQFSVLQVTDLFWSY
jgi:hypothetical protein